MKNFLNPKTILQLFALALTLQLLGPSGRADVNMRDASFISRSKDSPLLTRYYNSRSFHLGLFGYGWCTAFEKSLKKDPSGKVFLHDCLISKPTEVHPEITSEGLSIVIRDEDRLEFDKSGRLMRHIQRSKTTTFKYNSAGLLTEINEGDNGRMELSLRPPFYLVAKVITKKQDRMIAEATYEYENENLSAVRSTEIPKQRLRYDSKNNLIHIETRTPMGTLESETIVYDGNKDRVREYKDKKGCLTRFSFLPENESGSRFVSVAEKKCSGQVVGRATFRIDETLPAQQKRNLATARERID